MCIDYQEAWLGQHKYNVNVHVENSSGALAASIQELLSIPFLLVPFIFLFSVPCLLTPFVFLLIFPFFGAPFVILLCLEVIIRMISLITMQRSALT